jgi:hypothetical protein
MGVRKPHPHLQIENTMLKPLATGSMSTPIWHRMYAHSKIVPSLFLNRVISGSSTKRRCIVGNGPVRFVRVYSQHRANSKPM